MQLPVYNQQGELVRHIEISDSVFASPVNDGLIHQAIVRQQANARQGTAKVKTRGEVAGSSRKLFRQKHTGQARAGARKSPLRRGGGVVFGPQPRSYRQAMPKKMRRRALIGVLSAKVTDGDLIVLDAFNFEAPKTSAMALSLNAVGAKSSCLLVTQSPEPNVILSARNLPAVKTTFANLLNVVDLLSYKSLIMTEDAVRKAEELWGAK